MSRMHVLQKSPACSKNRSTLSGQKNIADEGVLIRIFHSSVASTNLSLILYM
jgi:hypothetical protein